MCMSVGQILQMIRFLLRPSLGSWFSRFLLCLLFLLSLVSKILLVSFVQEKNLSNFLLLVSHLFALIFKTFRLISFLSASNFQIGRTFLLLISKILFILAPSLIFFVVFFFCLILCLIPVSL